MVFIVWFCLIEEPFHILCPLQAGARLILCVGLSGGCLRAVLRANAYWQLVKWTPIAMSTDGMAPSFIKNINHYFCCPFFLFQFFK